MCIQGKANSRRSQGEQVLQEGVPNDAQGRSVKWEWEAGACLI